MWPGMGMMPPGPGMPGMAPPGMPGMGGMGGMGGMMPPAMKSAEQREPYTVFVSKIGDITDSVMTRLLSLCGTVLSWKRPQDTAGKVKGFGVCEFEGPEATMRAMRLLVGLQVDTHTIMLKLSAEMEKKVQEYRARADAMQAQPGFETPVDRQMRDQGVRQQVLRAAAEYTSGQNAVRLAAAPAAAAPAAAAPAVSAAAAPPPGVAATAPAPQASATASPLADGAPAAATAGSAAPQPVSQADKFLGGILGTSGATPAPDGHVPGTNLIVKKHSSRSPSPTRPKHDQSDRRRDGGRDNRREQEEERMKEREFRERERRWEDRERQLARERARDKERLTREADRAIEVGERTEQMLLEEDEDVEDMRRGALEDRQRRRKVRRRLREQELRDDAEDERRERAEEEQAKLQAEQAASGKQAAAASVSQAPPQRSPERPTASRPQHQSSAAAGPMMMGPVGPSLGAVGPSMPGASSPQAASGPAISMKAVAVSKPKAKTEAKVDRKPKNAAFAVEEDTGEIKRKLVKLDYGADAPSTGAAQAARSAAAAAAAMINQRRARGGESAADRAKRLIAGVPKEKKDLYALPVDWAVLEQSSTIEKKMQPWIAKKVTEYFGEKDETVISFVMEELEKHSSADDMVDNLGPVLADDCDDFVFKMWRMLIYEMLDQQDQIKSA